MLCDYTTSSTQSIFTEGNLIVLRSNSCGKSLRIIRGEVEGLGGLGPHGEGVRGHNIVWEEVQGVGREGPGPCMVR